MAIETIMLVATGIAALVGAILGWWAGIRSYQYDEEYAYLLRILGHHIGEPFLTIGSGLLVFNSFSGGLWPVTLCSLFSLLAPFAHYRWTVAWLEGHNRTLAKLAIARISTCVLVWISLITAPDLSDGDSGLLPLTTVIGTSVLWLSLIISGRMLLNFDRDKTNYGSGTQESTASV